MTEQTFRIQEILDERTRELLKNKRHRQHAVSRFPVIIATLAAGLYELCEARERHGFEPTPEVEAAMDQMERTICFAFREIFGHSMVVLDCSAEQHNWELIDDRNSCADGERYMRCRSCGKRQQPPTHEETIRLIRSAFPAMTRQEIADVLPPSTHEELMRLSSRKQRITKKQGVCGGRACVAGTRIPVWIIKQKLDRGATHSHILLELPSLAAEDIEAAIQYVVRNSEEIERDIAENNEVTT